MPFQPWIIIEMVAVATHSPQMECDGYFRFYSLAVIPAMMTEQAVGAGMRYTHDIHRQIYLSPAIRDCCGMYRRPSPPCENHGSGTNLAFGQLTLEAGRSLPGTVEDNARPEDQRRSPGRNILTPPFSAW